MRYWESPRTLQRWRHQPVDGRADVVRPEPLNKLSLVESEEILTAVNQPEYASLSLTQIVPRHLGLDRVFAAADETLDAQMPPGKQGQTQVDGRGTQGVDCILQTDREIVSAVEVACFANQECSQICLDMPVVPLVGIDQYRAPDGLTKTHDIQPPPIGQQTGLDVAQTLVLSQLSEGHGAKLFGAGQISNSGIASIAIYDTAETGPWNEPHGLSKKCLPHIQASSLEKSISGSYLNLEVWNLNSNRNQTKSPRKTSQYGVLSTNFLI